MKRSVRKSGFTLVEVLIVVVIMAILAATIIPQFTDSTSDAKASTTKFNLHTLRSQIELYKTQHNGVVPTGTLVELTKNTDIDGTQGTGTGFPYGPYIRQIPDNPFNNSDTVTVITNDPAVAADVTGTSGWLYNATTGGIWIDRAELSNRVDIARFKAISVAATRDGLLPRTFVLQNWPLFRRGNKGRFAAPRAATPRA